MPNVYYQTTSGLTGLVLRTIDLPGDTPNDANFTEDGDLPGLYVANAASASASQIASVELDGTAYDGGVIVSSGGLLWVVSRSAAEASVDTQSIIDGVTQQLAHEHGVGPWVKDSGRNGPSSNPARGWAERSGHTQIVDVQFQPEDAAGGVQTIRVEHAVQREVDSNTQASAGISIMGTDCVWNIPTAELAGLTMVVGTKVIQLDGTVWEVVAFGESVAGVFGEETRPICRQEV